MLACELIVAAQALEIRAPERVAPVASALLQLVRTVVPPLEDDRETTVDIERATGLIASGAALTAVRAALPQG